MRQSLTWDLQVGGKRGRLNNTWDMNLQEVIKTINMT